MSVDLAEVKNLLEIEKNLVDHPKLMPLLQRVQIRLTELSAMQDADNKKAAEAKAKADAEIAAKKQADAQAEADKAKAAEETETVRRPIPDEQGNLHV